MITSFQARDIHCEPYCTHFSRDLPLANVLMFLHLSLKLSRCLIDGCLPLLSKRKTQNIIYSYEGC